MPMTSDQVVWSEQNRLHIAYNEVEVTAGVFPEITVDITLPAANPEGAVRVGNSILISDNATGLVTLKALVTAVGGGAALNSLTCQVYEAGHAIPAGLATGAATNSMFVYGSEFPKGSNGMNGAITPSVTTYTNSPIIIKDNYELSGSDTALIVTGKQTYYL